ncbi:sugar transferase [Nocardioides panacihumi]|uniref:Sugar transferase n=1 Tax=Nocardioides panacihumi TaxID=400774 RepID=A0ABP5BID3_9ACTN
MTTLSVWGNRTTVGPSRALQYLPLTAFALDLTAIALACVAAVLGRSHLGIFDDAANVRGAATVVAPFLAVGWLAAIAVFGGYRSDIFGAGTDELQRTFRASASAAALVGIGCYLMKFQLSRGFFVLVFVIGAVLVLSARLLLRRALHSARVHGALFQRVVIAGGSAQVDDVAGVLRREKWLGYQLVGALVPGGRTGTETASGIPVLGDADDADDLTALDGIDVIFFTGGTQRTATDLRRIVWQLEQRSVHLVMAPAMTDFSSERVRTRPVGGLPLIHLQAPRWAFASRWAKRTFDIAATSALLLVIAPLFAFLALAVKLGDGGPVLFRQTRTGRHGEEFPCLKFRTMVVDAEARLAALHAETGHVNGFFKMKDDPRITAAGRWMRRLSLDELPQLINVLRGDMSLVGPRPPLPSEVAQYDGDTARRLNVRPGLTGLWQVSGRSDLSWEEAVRLDLYYVDNWSMMQDLSILSKTVGAVLSSRGAY